MYSVLARQPLWAPTVPLPPKAVCPPCCYEAGISVSFNYTSEDEEPFIYLNTGFVDICYAAEAKVHHPSLSCLVFSHPLSAIEPFLPQLKKKKGNLIKVF